GEHAVTGARVAAVEQLLRAKLARVVRDARRIDRVLARIRVARRFAEETTDLDRMVARRTKGVLVVAANFVRFLIKPRERANRSVVLHPAQNFRSGRRVALDVLNERGTIRLIAGHAARCHGPVELLVTGLMLSAELQ